MSGSSFFFFTSYFPNYPTASPHFFPLFSYKKINIISEISEEGRLGWFWLSLAS
jgi:hypothetical protein